MKYTNLNRDIAEQFWKGIIWPNYLANLHLSLSKRKQCPCTGINAFDYLWAFRRCVTLFSVEYYIHKGSNQRANCHIHILFNTASHGRVVHSFYSQSNSSGFVFQPGTIAPCQDINPHMPPFTQVFLICYSVTYLTACLRLGNNVRVSGAALRDGHVCSTCIWSHHHYYYHRIFYSFQFNIIILYSVLGAYNW